MNVRLLGFEAHAKKYEQRLKKLGCTLVHDGAQPGLVLVQQAKTLSELRPHVQSLNHVFVQQHSLKSSELQALYKLAHEAGVQVHFSAPALYCWSIPDLVHLLCDVKFVQVYKDYETAEPLQLKSLCNEILATACVVNTKIARVEKMRSVVPCDFDVMGLRVDFLNASSAFFWLGNAAFAARHELRIFGSKGMAVVDVLRREAKIKTLDGNFFTTPFLSEEEGEEKELADFVSKLRRGESAFISALEVEVLRSVEEKIMNN
ncbi:MAG: hypothetical protein LBU92_00385 [Prevotellaceae bacterium]|jgi:hypothetical protein|nr:hypothetical protein [Prevotellaceae bacterium]